MVVGLESGADDYVKKPFELPELIARLRAVLRRAAAPAEAEPIVAGPLEIDPAGFAVRKDGIELALTATEFRLLLELARRPGQVFTRELLLQRVWDYEYLGESHLVDVADRAAAGQGGRRSVTSGADQDDPRGRLPPGPGLSHGPAADPASAADAGGSGRAACGGGWSSPSCW